MVHGEKVSKQQGATGTSSGLIEPYNERMRVMSHKIGPFMVEQQLCVPLSQSHCHPIQFVVETGKKSKKRCTVSLINNKATINFQDISNQSLCIYFTPSL